jgi:hypothetical protein
VNTAQVLRCLIQVELLNISGLAAERDEFGVPGFHRYEMVDNGAEIAIEVFAV